MGYFPFFVDLSDQSGLIVGGGAVALRKAQKLLPYGPRLTVIAPRLAAGFQGLAGVMLLERPFSPGDLEEAAFAIAAADDRAVNRQVAELCKAQKIPVNVADGGGDGSFLFPALVKRGDLSVGISTGGASPLAAADLKERINGLLPERFEDILSFLQKQRERVKCALPEERERSLLLSELFQACMESEGPLSEEEAEARICAAQARSGGER